MWDAQVPALSQYFRLLRYDHRGHGGSPTPDGPYSIEDLAGDVLALLDHHGLERVNFVGLSLGGMVGMWLGAQHAERVDRLALCCTAPWFPTEPWVSRAAQVRKYGTASLETTLLERWFTSRLRSERPEILQRFAGMLATSSDEGYAGCCDAIAAMDQRDDLARIEAPTLLVFGAEDPVTTPEIGEAIRQAIPDAGLVVLPRAAHLANVEQAAAVSRALLDHLARDPLERGLARRRSVLGSSHVDRALASATEFTAPFQELITRYAWGEIWSRPSLPTETRRLLTIAMLAALGRHEELELHMRAALTAGLAHETLREVLLQTAVYAGVPAANSAFALAARILAEVGTETEVETAP
jgi:3-oxoadipate enol-lactonase/4-carboxymuconolactone decarboxylase